jgi:RNA polymerase sigma factor (sigma-70 family)
MYYTFQNMEIEASKKSRPHAGLTYKKLLDELMAAGAVNTDSSFHREFYFRFGRALFTVCSIVCSNHKQGEGMAKDIFQETIIKGIKNIYKFRYDEEDSETVVRKKVMAWFGIIAERELINYFRKKAKVEPVDEALEEIQSGDHLADFDQEQLIPISLERLRLQEALATLTDRERYIIMVCADHGCINIKKDDATEGGTIKQRHLPDEVIERLCQELKISKGNLRAIKNRAMTKLLQRLNENTDT